MKPLHLLLTIPILATLAFNIYSSRQIFFYQYEPEYYENWYYHSQYNYPQSTRGISDGELYKFVGYRLVEGENPFNINYEIPPLGKYLYGLAEHTIGNPLWVSLFIYLASTALVFLTAKLLFKQISLVLISTLLFATTPFVATQIRETMLDLPLMFFYLTHTYFFLRFLNHKKLLPLVFSGIFLGLATGTKPGIYTPFVVLLELIIILFITKDHQQSKPLSKAVIQPARSSFSEGGSQAATSRRISTKFKTKVLTRILTYPTSITSGYLLAFFCYFQRHPNPIPWLRLHKKAILFHLSSQNQVHHLDQWKGIFVNTYQGFWQGSISSSLGDWSPLLPLGVIATLLTLVWALKNKKNVWIYLSGLSLIFLLVNTFVPFWSRYLMPAIPLFVILTTHALKKYPAIIILIALLNLPFLYHSFDTSDPQGDLQATTRFISTRAYRELYRSIDPQQRAQIPEQLFTETYDNFLQAFGTRQIQVHLEPIEKTHPTQAQSLSQITYQTRYGPLTHSLTIQVQKIHNQWKTIWNWDYIWPNYQPHSTLSISESTIPLAKIVDIYDRTLAVRGTGKTVSVIPRLMFDWTQYLNTLSQITSQSSIQADQQIKSVVPDNFPIFVGYLDTLAETNTVDQALSLPGVSLEEISYLEIPRNSTSPTTISELIIQTKYDYPELFYVQIEASFTNDQGQTVALPFPQPEENNVTLQI